MCLGQVSWQAKLTRPLMNSPRDVEQINKAVVEKPKGFNHRTG
jgi:hypothetical protein